MSADPASGERAAFSIPARPGALDVPNWWKPRLGPLALVVGGIASIGAVALLAIIGWPASAYRDFDFIGLWLGGRALLEGMDLYDPAVWRALYIREGSAGYAFLPGGGYGYPLPTAVLAIPFGAFPLSVAAPLWLVTQIAIATGALWALSRRLFRRSLRRDALVVFALAGTAQSLWLTAYIGQISGFLIAITAGAAALLLASRPLAAGALLGLLALKPHLFLWAIPLLLLVSPQRRALALGGLVSGSALLAMSFLIRPDWPSAWMATALKLQGMNVTRANAWGLAPTDDRWLAWALVIPVVAAFVAWRWRTGSGPAEAWAAGLALSVFAAPYSWSYDHAVLVVPVAFGIAAVADAGPRLRVPVLVGLATAWVALPWILYVRAFRTGDEGVAGLVPLAVLAILLAATWLRSREAA